MSCNCKILKNKEEINADLVANEAKIYVSLKTKLIISMLFVLMSPIFITKSILRKWKKVTE